jgi:hypothetical protein
LSTRRRKIDQEELDRSGEAGVDFWEGEAKAWPRDQVEIAVEIPRLQRRGEQQGVFLPFGRGVEIRWIADADVVAVGALAPH